LNKLLFAVLFVVSFSLLLGSQTAFGQTFTFSNQQSEVSGNVLAGASSAPFVAVDNDCTGPVAGVAVSVSPLGDFAFVSAQENCSLNPSSISSQGTVETNHLVSLLGQEASAEGLLTFVVEFELTEDVNYQLSGLFTNIFSTTGNAQADTMAQLSLIDLGTLNEIEGFTSPPENAFLESGVLPVGNYRLTASAFSESNGLPPSEAAGLVSYDLELSISLFDNVIGGEIIPIETTSLLLAGTQTFSWMIPVVLSGIGIGLFVFRKSENS